MKMTSRILALAMALCLVLSLGAFASGEPAAKTAEEYIADMTPSSYATLDAVNSRSQDKGYIYVGIDVVDGEVTEESNWTGDPANIVLDNTVVGAGFTAVRASGEPSVVNVSGSLNLRNGENDANGEHASDFTGIGAAFVSFDGATVRVSDMDLETDGFVRAGFIVDHGATMWVEDSNVVTYGANPLTEAYEGYTNSANTGKMLSPPWVLGIQGGIRTVNVLDTEATFVAVNSNLASGGWGVISTDGCTRPTLIVIDSALEILPESEGGMDSGWALYGYDPDTYGSGYGAYLIGNCDERYYGSTIKGATFGAIGREGSVVYASSTGAIDVTSAKGEDLGTVQGKGNVTTIDAVFGAMTHSSEDVNISYTDGTIVNAEEAIVLYRSTGHANFTFDEAVLNSKAGILVQMIDDDDTTVGMGDFSTMGFNTYLYEDAGMPSQSGNLTGATSYNEEVNAVFTNGTYVGDLYNGTGYYGQAGDVMNVSVGEGALLKGDIALTETFHGVPYSAEAAAWADAQEEVEYVLIDGNYQITENAAEAAYIQFTQFSINQYYMLCRMENHLYNNGYSAINVTVEDGGVWTVEEESLITYLNVNGGAVYGDIVENADGSLTLVPSSNAITSGEYGVKVEANVAAAMGMGNAGGSGDPSGEASEEPAEEAGGTYADYIHEWLLAELAVNSSMTIEQIEDEFMPLIEAGDYVTFPADMLYNGMLNSGVALTFEEWSAQ